MSEPSYLYPFRNPDGSTSEPGQSNAGQWEKQQGYTPASQQAWESSEAYQQRINSGSNS